MILEGFLEKVTFKMSLKNKQSNDRKISRQGLLTKCTIRTVSARYINGTAS